MLAQRADAQHEVVIFLAPPAEAEAIG